MERQNPDYLQEFEQEPNFERATVGTRFVNHLIDIIGYYFLFRALSIMGVFPFIHRVSETANYEGTLYPSQPDIQSLENSLITLVVLIMSYTLLEGSTKGRTLGKLVTGTKAVKEDGSPIDWKDAFMRSLCRVVPFEPISALWGHPWHDRWTRTLVVREYD